MLVSRLVAAVVFVTGVAGASLLASGNKAAPEQAAPVQQPFEIVEAVGWDAGPGAPIDL